MFTQKVYKNGNSLAVTVPKELARELNIRDGSEIVVDKERGKITITARRKKKASAPDAKHAHLTPEFKQWLDDVSADEEKLIKELAKR